jgi:hypothetical protein
MLRQGRERRVGKAQLRTIISLRDEQAAARAQMITKLRALPAPEIGAAVSEGKGHAPVICEVRATKAIRRLTA